MSSDTPMQRRARDERTARPDGGGEDDGGNLEAIRSAAQDLMTAGDIAIAQALSGDSARFLWANRQSGGQ